MKIVIRHYHIELYSAEESVHSCTSDTLSQGLEYFCELAKTVISIEKSNELFKTLGEVVVLKEEAIKDTEQTYVINTSLEEGTVVLFYKCFERCPVSPSLN